MIITSTTNEIIAGRGNFRQGRMVVVRDNTVVDDGYANSDQGVVDGGYTSNSQQKLTDFQLHLKSTKIMKSTFSNRFSIERIIESKL